MAIDKAFIEAVMAKYGLGKLSDHGMLIDIEHKILSWNVMQWMQRANTGFFGSESIDTFTNRMAAIEKIIEEAMSENYKIALQEASTYLLDRLGLSEFGYKIAYGANKIHSMVLKGIKSANPDGVPDEMLSSHTAVFVPTSQELAGVFAVEGDDEAAQVRHAICKPIEHWAKGKYAPPLRPDFSCLKTEDGVWVISVHIHHTRQVCRDMDMMDAFLQGVAKAVVNQDSTCKGVILAGDFNSAILRYQPPVTACFAAKGMSADNILTYDEAALSNGSLPVKNDYRVIDCGFGEGIANESTSSISVDELNNQKTMLILRGVSGSGKTSVAMQLAKELDVKVCSVDSVFYNEAGEYQFKPKLLASAHSRCERRARAFMEAGERVVIIDNTNLQLWNYQSYIEDAQKNNYRVLQYAPTINGASIHSVPGKTIARLRKTFQDDPRFSKLDIDLAAVEQVSAKSLHQFTSSLDSGSALSLGAEAKAAGDQSAAGGEAKAAGDQSAAGGEAKASGVQYANNKSRFVYASTAAAAKKDAASGSVYSAR